MKRTAASVLAVLLCFVCALTASRVFSSAMGEAGTDTNIHAGDYVYDLLEDGTARITAYRGEESEIVLPDTLDGHRVTSIGRVAFSFNDSIERITLPTGLTEIEENPFYSCGKLTEIVVPEGNECFYTLDGVLFESSASRLVCYPAVLTDAEYTVPQGTRVIGAWAFGNDSIERLTLPDSVTQLGEYAFAFCPNLSEIALPESITDLSDGAFMSTGLQSIALPQGLVSLGKSSFAYCTALSDIVLPQGLQNIGSAAFDDCVSLESITIPDSVIGMGDNPFTGCTSLKEILVSEDQPCVCVRDGVLFRKENDSLICYPTALDAKEYAVPEGVRSIGSFAFFGSSLKSVTLREGVKSIGYGAFMRCENLEAIDLPDSLTLIEGHAFVNCFALQKIVIPDSVADIAAEAFLTCPKLREVIFPASLKSIGQQAFYNCGLENITLPEGIERIGEAAFAHNKGLTSINLPVSLTEIGRSSFTNCDLLVAAVQRDTYAETYCDEYGIAYTCSD